MTGAVQTKGCFGRFSLVYSVAISYSLAAIIGIGLGILIGTDKLMSKALDPSSSYCELYRPWLGCHCFAALRQNEDQQPFSWFYHRDMADFNQHSSGVKQIPKITTTSPKFCNFLVRNILISYTWCSSYIFLRAWELQLAWRRLLQQRLLCPALLVLAFFIWEAYQNNNVSEVILA